MCILGDSTNDQIALSLNSSSFDPNYLNSSSEMVFSGAKPAQKKEGVIRVQLKQKFNSENQFLRPSFSHRSSVRPPSSKKKTDKPKRTKHIHHATKYRRNRILRNLTRDENKTYDALISNKENNYHSNLSKGSQHRNKQMILNPRGLLARETYKPLRSSGDKAHNKKPKGLSETSNW